jgi:hypothetical protein
LTFEQVHRIIEATEQAIEDKKICTAVFLDVSQAFDRVWHKGLEYKLSSLLPKQYSNILTSYIRERIFRLKFEDEYSGIKQIKAGVPQGSELGPILYLLYTSDIPTTEHTLLATFADDTVVLTKGTNFEEAAVKAQKDLLDITNWTKIWRIKLNEQKSAHINFTYKKNKKKFNLK